MNTYRLDQLKVTDFKKIKEATVPLSGDIIIIGGNNAQGKSSVIDAFVCAIAGKKYAPKGAVRDEAQKAEIELTLETPSGRLLVKRQFNSDGKTELTVNSAAGFEAKSPQTMLDALFGELSIDPLAFAKEKPRDQVNILKKVFHIDTDALDARYAQGYEERTQTNTKVRDLEGKFKSVEETIPAGTPDEEILMSELHRKITEIKEGNRIYEEATVSLNAARQTLARLQEEIKGFEHIVSTVTRFDTSELEDQFASAEETNRNVRLKKEVAAGRAEWLAQKAKSEKLSAELLEIQAAKAKLIKSIDLPVRGLEFGDDGLILNGHPFEDISDSEKLLVSVPLAFAQNPNLKFCIIRDGSLLDEDSLAIVTELAINAGAQVIMERVSRGEECTVILEEGEIVEVTK